MGILSSVIGAGMNAAASIYGGIKNAQAYRQQMANNKGQQRLNEDWYNRRYNEDATQKADAQRLLTMTEESIKNRNKQAAGSAAIMGGTEESVAAAKAANNEALANTVSTINAAAEANKSAIEGQYMQRNAQLADQQNNMIAQKAANTAAAVQGVANAAGNIAGLGARQDQPTININYGKNGNN